MKDGKIWGCPAPTHAEVERLTAALAQAERELGEIRKSLYLCDQDRTRFAGELTEARAEVERLKGEIEQYEGWGEQRYREGREDGQRDAKANLARVRAAWPSAFPFPE